MIVVDNGFKVHVTMHGHRRHLSCLIKLSAKVLNLIKQTN